MSGFTRVLAGRQWNLLARALSVTVTSEDANRPKARMWNGDPADPYAAAAAVADLLITADLALAEGNMDTWSGGVPVGTTFPYVKRGGNGTLTQTSTAGERIGGSGSAIKITRGSSETRVDIDYVCRAGEELRLDMNQRRGPVGTATSNIQVQNLRTLRYLTGAGAWQTTKVSAFTSTSTTYANNLLTLTVEPLSVCQADEVILRVSFFASGGAADSNDACFDNCFLYPTWDLGVITGHNIPGSMVCTLRSSTDGFSGVNVVEHTFTVNQPAFYGLLVAREVARYARFMFAGTPADLIKLGNVSLGQTVALQKKQKPEVSTTREELAVRDEGAVNPRSYLLSGHSAIRQNLAFIGSLTHHADSLWNVYKRSRGGTYPLIWIPLDDQPEVYLGKLGPSSRETRRHQLVEYEYEFQELWTFSESA